MITSNTARKKRQQNQQQNTPWMQNILHPAFWAATTASEIFSATPLA
jgi:hypothetical protein